MKKMLFVGDSFTWGEGLELYMDKEPFITMRNQKSQDTELRALSDYRDTEVESWRNNHRFAAYVDGFDKYIQYNNGGTFHSLGRDANHLTSKHQFKKDDIVIIQIPPAERSFFHSNFNGEDEFGGPLERFYPAFEGIFNRPIHNQLTDFYTTKNIKLVESLYKIMGYESVDEMVKDSDNMMDKLSYRNTKLFYYSYVWDLIQRFDVYFIGPYGLSNHTAFSKCDEFKEKLIPLVYNGKEYDTLHNLEYYMWVDGGESFKIEDDYSKTTNQHPTPNVHKIIGESINKYFNG